LIFSSRCATLGAASYDEGRTEESVTVPGLRLGIHFELRNPEQWKRPWPEHYGASLELMEEAERLGIDAVKVAEHHLFVDGYIPQPLTFLAAAAARTKRIGLSTGILLAPLHHAAEIAEQAAVVDCLSGGRLELPLGAGYHRPEFDLYDVNVARRFRLLEERVKEMRELWAGGKVTPAPERGEIPIWLGVFGPRGSQLAGRLGTGLFTLSPKHWQLYAEAAEQAGHDRSVVRAGGGLTMILSDDPERDFEALKPRIKHQADTYLDAIYAGEPVYTTGQAAPPPPPRLDVSTLVPNVDALGTSVLTGFAVLTPEQAAAQIVDLVATHPGKIDIVYIQASPAHVADEIAFRNVQLVGTELRERLAAAGLGTATATPTGLGAA
jgi:alkanesulfonate monooxygenase SsuD/methylene tetrahydromethanopterin reductase-like flavin-dependent oxidoreductase (luciferase family)